MKVSIEALEKKEMSLKIEADPEDINDSLDKAYRELVNKVNIPGFRKGKIPRQIMERYVGSIMMREAVEHLIPQLYDRAIKEQGLEIFGEPELEVLQSTPLIFKAKVLLKPEIGLSDFRKLHIEKEKAEIKEEQVDDYLNRLRERNAVWVPVEREAKEGDLIVISAEGINKEYILEDKKLPQQLYQQLLGIKAGGDKEITLDDVVKKELGIDLQADTLKLAVTAVKEKQLPGLDDEFACSLGDGIENLNTLKERVRNNLLAIAEARAKQEYEDRILEQLVESSVIEYPEKLLDQEVDRLIEERTRSYGSSQEAVDKYIKDSGKTLPELREEVKPAAEKRLKGSLVLGKVALQEKIEVADKELNEEIERIIRNTGQRGPEMRKLLSNPVSRRSLYQTILTRKTLDFLASSVNVIPEEKENEDVTK